LYTACKNFPEDYFNTSINIATFLYVVLVETTLGLSVWCKNGSWRSPLF